MTRCRFSSPAVTRSTPSVNSCMVTACLPARAASSAASLTRLARSAPTNPEVMRATSRKSTELSTRTFWMWTSRISSRPRTSGRSTSTWRSKRPGRSRAGSSVSGRLVAAITITPLLDVHAVHFDQQRVEGLLAFVVPADHARAAGLAQGVEFVDEDDAGGLGHGLLEHVAHPCRADAHEHFHEVGAREAEERHTRLAGNGLAQQCLARARRPDQQHPLGNAAAEHLVLFGLLEEVDDFAEFFHGFVDAGDFVEGHADIFLGQQLPAAAAEGHGRAGPAQLLQQQITCDHGQDDTPASRDEHEIVPPRAGRSTTLEIMKTLGRKQAEQLAVVLIQPVARASEGRLLLLFL